VAEHGGDGRLRKRTMRREGAASRMEPRLYEGPPEPGMEVPDVM